MCLLKHGLHIILRIIWSRWIYRRSGILSSSSSSSSRSRGYEHPLDTVCCLRRALYGLKQAPCAWFSKFSTTITQFGFSSSSYDSAFFIRKTPRGITLLLLYVDDMIITGDDLDGIHELKHFLSSHFEIKDLGSLSYFLGLEISSAPSGLYLTQVKYTSDLLSHAGLTDSKTAPTPLEYNARLTSLEGTLLSDATGTLFHGLHYSAHTPLELCAYFDADWVGDPIDRRCTTNYCFFLGSSLISWRSKKQTVVSRSSIEAEYRALADITQELLWPRWLLKDMGVLHPTATTLHCY
ncbi:uncharacterized protein LOC114289030 [Camellia sinensis]|uniref:uncharacterized protein LOC114289030 n=1 Tax=Camellia sinensis TaxID=4442 RepID=UPI0010362238|nr:uncharacterized protein LOC114289030 [Camellia sinensis]